MESGKYRIAGRVVEIRSLYAQVQRYCADYAVQADTPADYIVEMSQQVIDAERSCQPENDRMLYPDSYIEELAVYRCIAEQMAFYDTLLMHGSVLALDGRAYLFTAPSGTGKSTHARMWRETFGERVVMVNDDKPLIGLTGEKPLVYGTPYNGKHGLGGNLSAPLCGICILSQAPENHIEPIERSAAYVRLLQQIYRPRQPEQLQLVMALFDRLLAQTPLYQMGCTISHEAAEMAYEMMRGK